MNLRSELERRLAAALAQVTGDESLPAMVAPATRPEFGDYQANGAMAAGKRLKTNPRGLAEKVVAAVDPGELIDRMEVAGPGFVNITLSQEWMGAALADRLTDDRLGVDKATPAQTIVVDYSHPNLAKEMHVGHLRSTIIGDAIVRVLEFLDHRVIRHNHMGDWGTQFGEILAYMDLLVEQGGTDLSMQLADLEEFYRAAKGLFDKDPAFAETARENVVKLQGGDPHCLKAWRRFVAESVRHCQRVYDKLGVSLTPEDVRPESAYNDDLPRIVADLQAKGLLTESRGALCVFLDEFKDRDGKALGIIIQKTGGGYLYATTDLAAVRYRAGELQADRILYIVDARQTLHLRQVFAISRLAGYAPASCSLEHHPFGTMQGADGKPFKTRTGGTVKLTDLLDEAEQRAFELVTDKNPDLPEDQRRRIAHVVGIGAVKYADLSQNRTSDYVFSFDRMLSLEGNTAPYMQYAYARVRSIFRKGGHEPAELAGEPVPVQEPTERALGLKLLQFPETLQTVADECLPNLLCAYLYDLAVAFSAFYESCPVLKSPEPVRSGRLALCDLTARTIRQGLGLLGIEVVEQM
ncbi:MAG: arginine--tRNA ligase [Planctomycetota bacterium]|jgi:arginyl-tRNA synthetase